MGRVRVLSVAVLWCGLASAMPVGGASALGKGVRSGEAGVQPSPDAARRLAGEIAHVRLTGDLDAMAGVEALADHLATLDPERVSLLVLEVGANRARPDVLAAIAGVVRASEIPAIVLLMDAGDRRVTAPLVALGVLIGGAIAIDPRTEVRFERGDWRLDVLPDGTFADTALEELGGAVEAALAEREIDPTIGSPWLPGEDAPSGEAIVPRRLHAQGVDVIEADRVARIVRALDLRAGTPAVVEIDAGIASAQEDVGRLIRFTDDGIAECRRTLNLTGRRPDDREVSVHDYRRAGAAALERLAQAGQAIERAEGVLRRYPELLLTAPPGRTDIGATRTSLRSGWRYRLDDLREDIEYWRQRANDAASR
ncbi:MAG: hypothetical protein KDA05_06185 [Phycisphaerales bacterium]|nr:hypothetical protein [Phycisphaerales bacterium]